MKQTDFREKAAFIKKHWVRLTRACNNSCLFCLDADVQDGKFLSEDEIKSDIKRGIEEYNAERLILSGGEPTIHPKFLDFISYGKSLGYKEIQTITNGRMFAYANFANKALACGLTEATISIHGHTPELHNELCRIPGAFEQAVRGLKNLLKNGNCIVSVDVVLNKKNYMFIYDFIKYFFKLGITEFDLLQIVPFGRTFPQNKNELLYNMEEAMPFLRKAFNFARKNNIVIWTNRFPVSYLEGYEELIQDPHKLFDEINGRRVMFQDFIEKDIMLTCYGERCEYCFIKEYCRMLLKHKESIAKSLPSLVEQKGRERTKKIISRPISLEKLIELCEINLNRNTIFWIFENIDFFIKNKEKVIFSIKNYETLGESKKNDVKPELLKKLSGKGFKTKNIPQCIIQGVPVVEEDILPARVLNGNSKINLDEFTRFFILTHYYSKSLRCKLCVNFDSCPGMHINYLRNFGYKILQPMT